MKVLWCFVVLSAIYSAVIEGQTTTKGFINIDCGETSGTTFQGILYVSDDSYIDTGENHNIDPTYPSSTNQARTLRRFPNGTRNCYTLWNVTKGEKYLVRATFLYGNYDGKQTVQTSSPIQFDLYIDVSFWRRVNITDASVEYAHEYRLFTSSVDYQEKILMTVYPDDPYDRLWHWHLYDTSILKSINTTASITHYRSDNFEAPYSVLQTALTPVSSSNLTTVSFDVTSDNPHPNLLLYYAVLHMTELQELSGNQSRQYDIYLNDFKWFPALKPPYCKAYYLANSGFQLQYFSHNVFTLVQLSNSTLPPILNAIEVYWSMTIEANQLTSTTDGHDYLIVLQYIMQWIDSCSTCGANSNKNTSTVIITISAVVVAVVVVIMGLLLLWILGRRTRRRGSTTEQYSETQVHSEMRKFTYEELKDITDSFSRTIGSGGFGNVYYGCLENQMEVAVKVCFQESTERNKQFLAEVRSLSLVHHRNLVTLVGYCKDGVNLAVVYEYLPRGSLLDHLRGLS
ncbi:hypothetical protein LUZ61_021158 [Rhynchospora tenuis]|uniref:Protein kinase domain-containing protein n=1 Tax=Rhynchospora tenuis TaxID=198213 RepID=A0AAD5Z2F9_9POAL|nr:hypothetical protein LUZ61_021158 [Rhynchospora tenuis]